MKKQHRIAGILSTTLMTGLFLSQPLFGQQSASQPPAQQPPETAQQPQQQDQPAPVQPQQPGVAPSGSTVPNTNGAQTAAPAGQGQPQQSPGATGTSVNPSQGPLQPVTPVTSYPDASGGTQDQPAATPAPAQNSAPEAPQPKKQSTEPVGAAAAESVPTAGGAAAKPAGVAIAPAKQHQTRSLLIKLGAVAAAGAALGVVFALSHSTSSNPPGTTTAGAIPH